MSIFLKCLGGNPIHGNLVKIVGLGLLNTSKFKTHDRRPLSNLQSMCQHCHSNTNRIILLDHNQQLRSKGRENLSVCALLSVYVVLSVCVCVSACVCVCEGLTLVLVMCECVFAMFTVQGRLAFDFIE